MLLRSKPPLRTAVALAVAGVLAGIALLIAIASGSDGSGDDRIVRTGEPDVEIEGGKINTDPAPLTLNDIRHAGRGSAAAVVLEVFYWTQWGGIPNVVSAYHEAVRRELGDGTIIDAYAAQRVQALQSEIRIGDISRTPRGSLLTVEEFGRQAPPTRDSFLLRKRGRRWQIVYDTLLERGLGSISSPGVRSKREQEARNRALLRRYRRVFVQDRQPQPPATATVPPAVGE